jgi:hypothetical protein
MQKQAHPLSVLASPHHHPTNEKSHFQWIPTRCLLLVLTAKSRSAAALTTRLLLPLSPRPSPLRPSFLVLSSLLVPPLSLPLSLFPGAAARPRPRPR